MTMNKLYNFLMLSALIIAAVGCNSAELDTIPAGTNSKDVKFGMSFDRPDTKTIYGPEVNNAFPIYWSKGDKVLVGSPQCAVTTAEYEVTPVTGQSYAEAMDKTGAVGIQWGSSEIADFYSVYPSNGAEWLELTDGNVTAKLNIASEQSANYVLSDNVYIAADMQNIIMYAQTDDVSKGNTVNLRYKPYSTVLEFELNIGTIVDEQGNDTKKYGSAKIMSITLTAPNGTDISGDFSLKFKGNTAPEIEARGNNGNSIAMHFTTYPMLDEINKSLKAKMALVPLSGVKIEGWTFTVEYLDGTNTATTTKTKTMTINEVLEPGQIHKIKLPIFPTEEVAWNPEMDKWISSLYDYKNIYLTELSLPGAWYAGAPTSEKYQSTADISTLWNAGVRAFAVECRTLSGFNLLGGGTPEAVVVSGTGRNSTYDDYREPVTGSATKIRSIIKSIANQVASSSEFAVLVLSYADGGEGGHRDVDHNYFINGIKKEIANAGVTNVYTGPVTANTTVNDVIGKVIIKINVDNQLTKSSYAGDMNALLSYNPFLQQLTDVDYTEPLFSKLYWGNWEDSFKVTTSVSNDFLWCFASANRTQVDTGTDTTIPTYAQRQKALRGMIEHSKELTASESHNVWFYFNAGGVQTTSSTDKTTSPTDFAAKMNEWLYNLVSLKANGGTDEIGVYGTKGAYVESEPSPLGIVMFNQCTNTDYKGPKIVKEIVHMNNKFKLLRETTTDGSGGGDDGEGDEI